MMGPIPMEARLLLWIGTDSTTASLRKIDDHPLVATYQGRVLDSGGFSGLAALFADIESACRAAVGLLPAVAQEIGTDGSWRCAILFVSGSGGMSVSDWLLQAVTIASLGHPGQILLNEQAGERAERTLTRPFGVLQLGAVRTADLQRPKEVYQLTHPDLPAEFPPLRSLDAVPTNLPTQFTRFLCREDHLVRALALARETNLMTLSGPAGVGKTRLALHVAAHLAHRFAGGAWLIELARVSDPGALPQAIAQALQLEIRPDRGLMEGLEQVLRNKRMLLIVDNCEHLVDAVASVVQRLLEACPHLVILATSRERLGVAGEVVLKVDPLPIPKASVSAPEQLLTYGSVRMFADRAGVALPGFKVDSSNAAAVARICTRLGGLPLAIELAAVRVRGLAPADIATNLEEAMVTLSSGLRSAPQRHRTLRAAIEWSYTLLSDGEQRLLRRLAIFAGGFTLKAMESVCPDSGDALPGLEGLLQLVDKSLVVVSERACQTRYQLLEPIRQYAHNRLEEAGEWECTNRRHQEWALELAETAATFWTPEWVEQVDQEQENLQAALVRFRDLKDWAGGLRLSVAMAMWYRRLRVREGVDWLRLFLRHYGDQGTPLQALGEVRLSDLFLFCGMHQESVAYGEKALPLVRKLGLVEAEAEIRICLGSVAMRQASMDLASTHFEEARSIYDRLDLPRQEAVILGYLAVLAKRKGEYDRARALLEAGLNRTRRTNYLAATGSVLYHLADLSYRQKAFDEARRLFLEALAIQRETNYVSQAMETLIGLARLEAAQGQTEQALAYLGESLEMIRSTGDRFALVRWIGVVARTAVVLGQNGTALRLFAAVETLSRAFGISPSESDQAEVAELIAPIRALLPPAEFRRCWSEGGLLAEDAAVALALSVTEERPQEPHPSPVPEQHAKGEPAGGLTARQWEIVTLVAQGLSNKEIAKQLFVSPHTVDRHLENVYVRLGLSSRTKLTAWVVSQGGMPLHR